MAAHTAGDVGAFYYYYPMSQLPICCACFTDARTTEIRFCVFPLCMCRLNFCSACSFDHHDHVKRIIGHAQFDTVPQCVKSTGSAPTPAHTATKKPFETKATFSSSKFSEEISKTKAWASKTQRKVIANTSNAQNRMAQCSDFGFCDIAQYADSNPGVNCRSTKFQ